MLAKPADQRTKLWTRLFRSEGTLPTSGSGRRQRRL